MKKAFNNLLWSAGTVCSCTASTKLQICVLFEGEANLKHCMRHLIDPVCFGVKQNSHWTNSTVAHIWDAMSITLTVKTTKQWRCFFFNDVCLCSRPGESAMRRGVRVWGHGLHLGQAGVGRAQRWGGTRQGLQQRRPLHRSVHTHTHTHTQRCQ